ncbi:CobW family GTP-binding protein [Marinobacter sp. VGCF2001]|uniref:CobW family GTP-binding protein n=1 Tax=Marinobacter sp. VGCF2001 TaxID=3417189 RepID=UPI003CF47EF3
MSTNTRPIPTNLILGFLGVGKTTAILDLLRQKPEGETWAVLVNEFGEVGIDGAILETEGAVVREVPGGCMCCVAGLPMQIGLNQLIARARPDRLLIEPTGLGHPSQILDILTGEHYREVLALGPVTTLVDPRKLENPKVLENVQFRDQIEAADILVANKTDLCSAAQLAAFDAWVARLPEARRAVYKTRQGQLQPEWLHGEWGSHSVSNPEAHRQRAALELRPQPPSLEDQPWQRMSNHGSGHYSVGWRVHPELQFSEAALLALAMDERLVRFKAVVHTIDGWRVVNQVEGALTVQPCEPGEQSRIELISAEPLVEASLDQQMKRAAGLED